ncbi:MAG: ammonium transporter, partial [Proteobacteria bacterium]|nr:ammonium transporter [Pseudomonadota bacterium]
EAPKPKVDKGDTAWMLMATVLVILMTIPGLALFYAGMVRSKNVLSVLMQVFVCFCMIAVLWVIYGYSVAFSSGNAFFGGFSKMFLSGVNADAVAATFSKGVVIPELAFVAFQLTFAAITPALIVGAFAERVKFSAVLVFVVLWFTFAYLPIAHMVWYWDGPDAITDAKTLETVTAAAGWLWAKGALDFAGGTVVHIKNTLVATASATLAWSLIESIGKGKASMLGAVSGAVAGLVAITPACGYVGTMGALVIGAVAGLVCYWGVNGLKRMLGADDSLDVFGVHGLGGATGAILTGVFAAPSLGGSGIFDYVANKASDTYSIWDQVVIQATGCLTTVIWSGVVAFIAFKLVDLTIGLRVTEEEEREGLDVSSHGEGAYRM